MKLKNILLSSVVAMGTIAASAQEAKTIEVFVPHWYIQGQFGTQYTLGEISSNKLMSPNAQVGVGYNFNKVVGARLSVNAWQSKAGMKSWGSMVNGIGDLTSVAKWKWNYVAPMIDATFNLTNLFCDYNPNRLVTVGVFAGLGANIAWNNGAKDLEMQDFVNENTYAEFMADDYVWRHNRTNLTARVGANVDFRITDNLSVGLEVQANTLSDRYNSKRAGNPDWYFNGLVGVKYAFGKTHTTKIIPAPVPVERIVERVVEKQVPAQTCCEAKKETTAKQDTEFRRDIFFKLAGTNIANSEVKKVNEVVDYLKANPSAKVTVTGYADKGTGSEQINEKISEERAEVVYNELIKKGIPAGRILKDYKGARVQPFEVNNDNRVTICIAK